MKMATIFGQVANINYCQPDSNDSFCQMLIKLPHADHHLSAKSPIQTLDLISFSPTFSPMTDTGTCCTAGCVTEDTPATLDK